jgi:thioredoxin-like negative regulator of GroEL
MKIKVITEKDAIQLVSDKENVVIVHSSDTCPICDHFVPQVLEPIFDDYGNVEVRIVKEKLTFPVAAHPVVYFFKNGTCVQHPSGAAPEKAVRDMMDTFYGNS